MPTFRQDEKLGTKVPLIKTADFNDKSVTTEKLAEGSVTNSKLAPESVTQDKFDKELLQIFKAAAGLPENLIETIQNVDSTLVDHQRQISSNDDDISDLQTKTKQIKDTVDGIAISGGASVGSAVTYDNTQSGLDAQNIQNAIDELVNNLGHYETNEEWLRVYTDAEGKFLWGIRVDGSIDWSVGIPKPIQKALNEIIVNNETFQQTLTEAMEAYKATIDEKVAAIDKKKVDKEEGKSLIEDEVKECFKVIENDEFIKAITDTDGRILFGFRRDTGKPYYPLNEMYHVIQNEEYFAAWVTTDDKVVLGIRRDGQIIGEIHAVNALKQVIAQLQADVAALQEKVGTIDTNLKELLDVFSLQDNEEYLAVERDAEGKILSSTNPDGSHYIHNAKSETIPTEFEHIEDPEGRTEITTDADGKVMSYRDADGKKHEHDMEVTNLDVSNLNLQGNSVNNIQDALKANGFDVKTPIDWSESSFIQIPEPRFAIINITNIDSMPTTKQDNKKAFLEFWDMQGNYFKKHAILNAQGNSSMGFPKKNVSVDICDDEWLGEDTPKIRIGKWVPQDSFHMKAYYTDFFRGVGAVSYKLYDQIVLTRGALYDRPWKKALLDMSKIGTTTKSLGNPNVGNYDLLTDTGARCFPDGFPVAIYLNDVFYGIFSFQLKKHRDNYHLDKSTAENVHLDGTLNYYTIFGGKDNINWGEFEIRNPKGLYTIGGNKYDADIKQEEIAGETEVDSWIADGILPDGTEITSKIKKNLQLTVKVKKYIQNLSDAVGVIKAAEAAYNASSKTSEDLSTFKKVYEKYFDVENMIDYIIVSDIIKNGDGFSKNWQFFCYDGIKWFVGLYDCDMTFGCEWSYITDTLTGHLNSSVDSPHGFIIKYYNDELEKRYKELMDCGIISPNNIYSLITDWMQRIGTSFFKQEYKKWKESLCISDSVVRSEYWETVKDEKGNHEVADEETFNATVSYNIGDIVSFGINKNMGFFKFKCIKKTIAISSNTPHSISPCSPISLFRHCDNVYRIYKWIVDNVNNMNKLYNYK